MRSEVHWRSHGQRDRPRRHAHVDRGAGPRSSAPSPPSTPPSTRASRCIDTADAYHLTPDDDGPQRAAHRQGPGDLRRRHRRRAGRHQGRPSSGAGRRLVDRGRLARAPARGRGGVAAAPRGRRHRPLPVPPPRPRGPVRGVDRRTSRTCSTRARSGWPASPTPTSRQIDRPPRRCSARAIWPASRTSSRRPSGPATTNCEHCAEHGIAFLPWSPLGGSDRAGDLGARHSAFAGGRRRARRLARSGSPWPGCWPWHRW